MIIIFVFGCKKFFVDIWYYMYLYYLVLYRYYLVLYRYYLVLYWYYLVLYRYCLVLYRYYLELYRYYLVLYRYLLSGILSVLSVIVGRGRLPLPEHRPVGVHEREPGDPGHTPEPRVHPTPPLQPGRSEPGDIPVMCGRWTRR